MCKECYVDKNRITPLLNPAACIKNHLQYICGSCGRCICIDKDPQRSLQRWQFPFKSLEIAKLYLRTADYSMKKACGIYEIKSENKRLSYKIFPSQEDLKRYLKKNKTKASTSTAPLFCMTDYHDFPDTQVRRLMPAEIDQYLSER